MITMMARKVKRRLLHNSFALGLVSIRIIIMWIKFFPIICILVVKRNSVP